MNGLNMKTVWRSLLLFAWAMCASVATLSATQTKAPEALRGADQDFDQWLVTDQGQKASLAQMRQRC